MNVLLLPLKLLRALGSVLRYLLFSIAACMFLAGLCLLGYQVYAGLMYGTWPALPLQMYFAYLTPLTTWIESPQSWYGLHKLLTEHLAFTPLSLFLLLAGLLIAIVIELLEASWQEYRAIWRFLNTPLVLLLLGILAAGTLLYSWDKHQATRTLHRESNRYTLESLYRLNTLIETLPPQTTTTTLAQWQRVKALLAGEKPFTPLFNEFAGLRLEGLIYYLTSRLPQEQVQLQGVQQTLRQIERFPALVEAMATPHGDPALQQMLTAEQQQALSALHERLQRHVSDLAAFLHH
jgi:hypothetical protein